MPRSCAKILETIVLGIPGSACSSHTVADLCWLQSMHVQHSQVLCLLQAFQRCGSFSTDSWWSLKCLCHTFTCAALIALSLKASLYPPNSFHGGMFKLNSKPDADSFCIHSVILNAMATQYTGSLNGIYSSHWLVQWSRHCSCMCIPVHSPWLPGYTDVTETVLVILTRAGLFLADLIHLFSYSSRGEKPKIILWGQNQGFSRAILTPKVLGGIPLFSRE